MNRKELRGALAYLESAEFAAEVGIASSLGMFAEILAENEIVARITETLRENLSLAEVIYNRVLQIARLEFDQQYENPYDIALSAYVWIIYEVSRPLGEITIDAAALTRQTWWTPKVTALLREERTHHVVDTNSTTKKLDLPMMISVHSFSLENTLFPKVVQGPNLTPIAQSGHSVIMFADMVFGYEDAFPKVVEWGNAPPFEALTGMVDNSLKMHVEMKNRSVGKLVPAGK